MRKILIVAIALVLGPGSAALCRTQGDIVAGPLRFEKNYNYQDQTPFYIERVRVGEYAWFPSPVIIEDPAGERDAQPFIGKDVLVFGEYTQIPIAPPYQMEIDHIPALVARRVLPVENRQHTVFSIDKLPEGLDEKETDIKFTVINPLPYELDAAEIMVDLEGHFQFEDGRREQYTTHHRQINPVFKAHEKKEFRFSLVPSDLEREKGHFAVSIMFWGYYVKDDVIEPAYAFWKRQW